LGSYFFKKPIYVKIVGLILTNLFLATLGLQY